MLWICPGFSADEYDVNCIPPLQSLARSLISHGVDLRIITLGYPFHSRAYTWHGIPVVSAYGLNGRWFRWMNWFRAARYARQWNTDVKFDVIHSFWLGPCWLIGQYLRGLWKIPHFTTLMGQDILNDNVYLRFLRNRHFASLIALSEYQNQIFKKSTGHFAAHTIGWGLGTEDNPSTMAPQRPLTILGCGSLIPLKNWPLWIKVVAKLVSGNPDLRAEIIGDGPDKNALERIINQAGLNQCIKLRGSLPRPEVLKRMRETKVFLHTAKYESFGYVLLEAAGSGCQVVSTPVGIARDLARCGNSVDELYNQAVKALYSPAHPQPQTQHLPLKSMDDTAVRYLELVAKKHSLR